MTVKNSGEFVFFKDTLTGQSEETLGLVVRTSTNHKEDGSTDEWTELVPLPMILVKTADVRGINDPVATDGSAVVGSSATDITGINNPSSTQLEENKDKANEKDKSK